MNDHDLRALELDLHATGAVLPVTARLCTTFDFLYGGSGLAACAVAAEHVTGRPLQWITTQYVDNAHPGEEMRLDVDVVATGRATSQTHVHGRIGDRTVLHATTAHTSRPAGELRWWGEPPAVSGPDDSEPFVLPLDGPNSGSFVEVMHRRLPPEAAALIPSGRVAIWVKVDGWPIGSPASQGFVADVVPIAFTLAMGRDPGGTSLDNTMRVVVNDDLDEWVLLDIEAEGFHHSIGHGRVRLWRPDGRLIGVGSQSAIIRTSHHDRLRCGQTGAGD
ncbi:MAG: acyl-CoA thioesterase [Desertimonas sp.]